MLSNFDFSVVLTALPYLFGTGMVFTLSLTAMAAAGGVVLGTLLAMARLSGIPGVWHLAKGYVELCRSLPLVLVIFWFYFLVPYIGAYVVGSTTPIQVGAFPRRSSPSRRSRRPISPRSCARASSRCRRGRPPPRRRSA